MNLAKEQIEKGENDLLESMKNTRQEILLQAREFIS